MSPGISIDATAWGCRRDSAPSSFPEWITYDDWGYPIIRPDPIPEHLRDERITPSTPAPRVALTLVKR